ncbi:hypothetical protein CDD83_10883 [Cordyceps sp. RAO-2017]|nr:hypothetical protein CDD83_10883 [Cordyceps sp. RAO-2017]
MADSAGSAAGKSAEAPREVAKDRTVPSQKIAPSSPQASPRGAPGKAKRPESSSESEDETPPPSRSHPPGHLASKSIADRQRKPSELAIRQRSQSAAQPSPVGRPTTAVGHQASKPAEAASSSAVDASHHGDEAEQGKKRDEAPASAAASAGRGAQPAGTASRPPAATRVTRPARGQYTAAPPFHDPKKAPDVEPAPASGMYWSKALVCGAPHPNLRAHTATLIGSNIYVFGGWDSRTCFNNMYVLDADAFYWYVPQLAGEIPMPLRAMTCTAIGKKLVLFGGGDGPTYYNGVYVLDTLNFRWSRPRIVGDKMPCPRRAHTACLYKNGIYVFGGGDGDKALNDIWRLDVGDPAKMAWKLISSPDPSHPTSRDRRPKARGYHTANMSGSKLIVFGGSDGTECFDDVWIYDVDMHMWKSVDIAVTHRRLSHTATLVGSYLFVLGGHDGDEYCNDVLLLNLVTMTWDKRKVYGKAPSGRGYHAALLHDSRLLMIGGFDGNEVFGDVMILELAVHAYYSQISHFTIDV